MSALYNRHRELESLYTHAAHFAACLAAAERGEVLAPPYVLAKRGPIVYCGVIKNLWTSRKGVDCWNIDTLWPEVAQICVSAANVILCPVEGCSCADFGGGNALLPDPAFCQAGVVAPPDSPNIGNLALLSGPSF